VIPAFWGAREQVGDSFGAQLTLFAPNAWAAGQASIGMGVIPAFWGKRAGGRQLWPPTHLTYTQFTAAEQASVGLGVIPAFWGAREQVGDSFGPQLT
jgi:hypothetical protein